MRDSETAEGSNPSLNEDLHYVCEQWLAASIDRRELMARLVRGGVGLAAVTIFGGSLTGCGDRDASPSVSSAETTSKDEPSGTLPFSFQGVSIGNADAVTVPTGYTARVLYAWGDPIGVQGLAAGQPAFKSDASNTAEEQADQAGMNHDGMQFFPLPRGSSSSTWGLLAINHEHTDDGLLHVGGRTPWTAEKVTKAQNALGVSVVEVEFRNDTWTVVRPSSFARRITARTPIRLSGPVAGTDLVKTASDPDGLTVLGTLNNCASGVTPWGTYLTCEENWNGYFVNDATISDDQARYGLTKDGFGHQWDRYDPRFDADANPHEPNRFGWVVEIDPYDPQSMPVKRTALGRIKHEGAWVTVAPDNRIVCYMGDDENFEYIYKFVSRDAWNPDDRAVNQDLLDYGTLYVAKFNSDGTGRWLELEQGLNNLTAVNGFFTQADVLVKTRQAADRVGATKMDRPEWISSHPTTHDVYVTLTNNVQRGMAGRPEADSANPRTNNIFGHIVRWREEAGNATAVRFVWDVFLLCGDPTQGDVSRQGSLAGDIFACPDGLRFDPRGILWIQTDMSTNAQGTGEYANFGNNQLLACDVDTGTTRRFLVGPKGCEVTGVSYTPDQCTLFINIQHPGKIPGQLSDPAQPTAISAWPDGPTGGRPRAATVVIRKNDGGLIGT
ncbi:MAG: PhoX family phosphatase [Nitrospiraceae bacterium]